MNDSVIVAAQFSVAAIISAVGILALAGTFIAVNRLLHMFWIPTNIAQKIMNFLNDKGAASRKVEPTINYSNAPVGVPVMTPDGKIVVNVGEGGGGGITKDKQ